jgi:hypothetical protein
VTFKVLVAWQEVSLPTGCKLPAFILDAEKGKDPAHQCSDNKVVLNAQGEEVVILDD